MAQVTVMGMGAMGSTLARVLAECGHEVTVWNRSGLGPGRGEGLASADGAAGAGAAVRVATSPAAGDQASSDTHLDGAGRWQLCRPPAPDRPLPRTISEV